MICLSHRSIEIAVLPVLLFCSFFGLACYAENSELKVATPGFAFSFPRDHGAHPSYETEWWYYTGQLYQKGAEPFRDPPAYGFQLTFFRRASSIGSGLTQDYMSHAAITDIKGGRTLFSARTGGGALGLANVSTSNLMAWSGDWSADLIGEQHLLRYALPIGGENGPRADTLFVRLLATPSSGIWLQGEDGFSRKGKCPSCASIYYSLPAMKIEGALNRENKLEPISGIGWMDHEFMSNSMEKDQQGWDWAGLMFRDGRRLTVFQMRSTSGGVDFRGGSIRVGERSISLKNEDFSMTPTKMWRSPSSQIEYPISWRVQVPGHGIDIEVGARVAACEVGSSGEKDLPTYWEGPVASADESVLGYLEMTGYAGRMEL